MKKHKIWIPVTAVVLAVAAIAAMVVVPRMSKTEVAVYPVNMVGYTDFYGSVNESYGMVTTDKVQTLYVSSTQTVTEILVYPGQEVKKGDVLFRIDPTRYQALADMCKSEIAQLDVRIKDALVKLNRQKYLLERNATSRDELESAQATYDELTAARAAAPDLVLSAGHVHDTLGRIFEYGRKCAVRSAVFLIGICRKQQVRFGHKSVFL